MFDKKEKEGTKRRHQVDTVVEGMCVSFMSGSFGNDTDLACASAALTDSLKTLSSHYQLSMTRFG